MIGIQLYHMALDQFIWFCLQTIAIVIKISLFIVRIDNLADFIVTFWYIKLVY